MRLAAAAGLLLALPSIASAGRPITAGVSAGQTQMKSEASQDANHTLGLWGRLGFTPRVAGQLELQRIQTDASSNVDIRTVSGLLVVDLGSGGHLMPVILAGVGFDNASTPYGTSTDATHIEGGFGLEYRADGGLSIGVDARMGGRSINNNNMYQPLMGGVAYYQPSNLHDGEYRSVRLTVGVRF
jgi:Outer membrane protein beta-barrel domain